MTVADTWRAYAAEAPIAIPDTTPPTIPTDVAAAFVSPDATVTWTASTDTHGIAVYTVSRDGANVGSTAGTTTFVDHDVPVGDHIYQVQATDPAGNTSSRSAWSNSITVTAPDTTPPTTPTSPTATYSAPTVTFSWGASTDTESGLSVYVISRNGVDIFFQTGTTFLDSGRPPGTYVYGVRALDNAAPANESAVATATVTISAITSFTPHLSDATGANDVGGEMQSFFDALPQGTALAPTVVLFPLNAIYRCERTIQPKKSHLVVHGNGATILHTTTGPSGGQMFIEGPTSDISVDHLIVRSNQPEPGSSGAIALAAAQGIHPYLGTARATSGIYRGGAYEGMYGWRIAGKNTGAQEGCDNIHLDHCDVYNVWSDFWNFESHHRHTNCTLTNSKGHVSGRQGFVPGDVENFVADGLTIERVARTSIDIEPGQSPFGGVQGLTIKNSTIAYGVLGFISFQVGAVGNDVLIQNVLGIKRSAQIVFGSHALDGGTARDGLTIIHVQGDADWNNQKAQGDYQFDIRNTTNIYVHDCYQDFKPAQPFYTVGYDQDSTLTSVGGNGGQNIIGQSHQYTYVP